MKELKDHLKFPSAQRKETDKWKQKYVNATILTLRLLFSFCSVSITLLRLSLASFDSLFSLSWSSICNCFNSDTLWDSSVRIFVISAAIWDAMYRERKGNYINMTAEAGFGKACRKDKSKPAQLSKECNNVKQSKKTGIHMSLPMPSCMKI